MSFSNITQYVPVVKHKRSLCLTHLQLYSVHYRSIKGLITEVSGRLEILDCGSGQMLLFMSMDNQQY